MCHFYCGLPSCADHVTYGIFFLTWDLESRLWRLYELTCFFVSRVCLSLRGGCGACARAEEPQIHHSAPTTVLGPQTFTEVWDCSHISIVWQRRKNTRVAARECVGHSTPTLAWMPHRERVAGWPGGPRWQGEQSQNHRQLSVAASKSWPETLFRS